MKVSEQRQEHKGWQFPDSLVFNKINSQFIIPNPPIKFSPQTKHEEKFSLQKKYFFFNFWDWSPHERVENIKDTNSLVTLLQRVTKILIKKVNDKSYSASTRALSSLSFSSFSPWILFWIWMDSNSASYNKIESLLQNEPSRSVTFSKVAGWS